MCLLHLGRYLEYCRRSSPLLPPPCFVQPLPFPLYAVAEPPPICHPLVWVAYTVPLCTVADALSSVTPLFGIASTVLRCTVADHPPNVTPCFISYLPSLSVLSQILLSSVPLALHRLCLFLSVLSRIHPRVFPPLVCVASACFLPMLSPILLPSVPIVVNCLCCSSMCRRRSSPRYKCHWVRIFQAW